MSKIKVAIAGIGNCASSLIQGVEFYRWVDADSGFIPGLTNSVLGNYLIRDIEFVAAFDVDKNKVGLDLSHAIFAAPNCASKICDVPLSGVEVMRGHLLDGVEGKLKDVIKIDNLQQEVNVNEVLVQSGAELLINYLPTGSIKATEFYAEQAIKAKCGFINGIPESIASNIIWNDRFKRAKLPLVGDDIKSQLGASALHRSLIELFMRCGCKINSTSQLNFGNNSDFLNLSDPQRSTSKNISKIAAFKNIIPYPVDIEVHIKNDATQNFNCQDAKKVQIHIDGVNFGSKPLSIDATLCVEDSPNGAGTMVDVIRSMKVALNRNDSGIINPICSSYFKNPPVTCDDNSASLALANYLEN
jgi:myo-inositol-1-phosphate synthase